LNAVNVINNGLIAKNNQLATDLYTIKTIKNFDNKAIENLEVNKLQNENANLKEYLNKVMEGNKLLLNTIHEKSTKIENQRKELKRLNFEYDKAKEFVQNVKPKDEEKKQVFQQRFECVLHPLKCEHLKNDFCLNKKECWGKMPLIK
jgi:predicted  nucleic acid-binding Zn-ribbon protein